MKVIKLTPILGCLFFAGINTAIAQWSTSGTNIYNSNTGNIGIGTNNPLSKFVVQDGFGSSQMRIDGSLSPVGYSYTSPTGGIRIAGFSSNGSPAEIGGIRFNLVNGTVGSETGSMTLSTANNGTLSPKMVIDNIGNVGIGINTPAYPLQLSSRAVKTNTGNNLIAMLGSNEGAASFGLKIAETGAGSVAGSYVLLQSGDNVLNAGTLALQRWGGNVGIGTTSPRGKLSIDGSASHNYLSIDADLAYQSSLSYGDHTYGQDIVCYRPENTRDYSIYTSTAGSALYVTQAGNVGIGTTSPDAKLSVNGSIDAGPGTIGYPAYTFYRATSTYGSTGFYAPAANTIGVVVAGTEEMRFTDQGNVGIGTTTPDAKLSVNGSIDAGPGTIGYPAYTFYPATRTYGSTGFYAPAANMIGVVVAGGEQMRFATNGNIGIGTTSPGYKLDVNGIIRANEVKVCSFGTCDFVFEKNYNLMQIDSLSAYLNQNHHLPGIASAKEMESEGTVSLGKMNSQLLQKVEELTLYIIEQDKKASEQDKRITELENKVK